MNTFIIRRLLPVLLLVVPAFAFACSCGHAPPNLKTPLAQAEWRLNRSETVFEGVVDHIEIKGWPLKVVPGETLSVQTKISVAFTGVRMYRGAGRQSLVVETGIGGGDCGYPFETGRSYLVSAWPDEAGQLSTGICSATFPIEFAGTELRMLRGEPPTSQDLKDLSVDSGENRAAVATQPKNLCGKVLLPKGVQIESLDVRVWKLDKDSKSFPLAKGETQAEASGSFCITGIDPGKYIVGAQESDPERQGFRYIAYYPGTAHRSEAKPVEFSTSKANPQVEFPLIRQPLFEVRGRINGPRVADLKVMLMRTDPNDVDLPEPVEPGPDGAFEFDNVPPGQYSAFAFVDAGEGQFTFLSAALDVEVIENREGLKLDLVQKK